MNKIEALTLQKLKELNLTSDEYIDRLKTEIAEIRKQGLFPYFEELVTSGVKRPNENNLLVAFLLGICDEDPVASGKELIWTQSNDFPDIDVDYTPECRSAIKKWITDEFGADRVVSIANFAVFGIKSGLRDVGRVFEVPLSEINALTVPMDNSVNRMEWDEVIKLYPKLAEFESKYPEVCKIVKKLKGRHKAFGTHAAGVVISSTPIAEQVPLLARAIGDDKHKTKLSQWTEGQATSDLKTFGYVKFDILGLENLNYIDRTLNILGNIPMCRAHHSDRDWSDDSYLNDPESLATASRGELTTIFQFDSPGIQTLVRSGGVERFEDLAAYSSLFRPGPLQSGIAEEYIRRKRGQNSGWRDETPELILPIVEETMGVPIYQEQLMQIINKIGLVSLPDCERIRKAMGQKQREKFAVYRDQFVKNASKTVGWNEHEAAKYWDKLEDFAGYGFNKCITPDSIVETESGYKLAGECEKGDRIKAYDPQSGDSFFDEVIARHDNGQQELVEVELDNGRKIKCTMDHEFLCEDGTKRKLEIILMEGYRIIAED